MPSHRLPLSAVRLGLYPSQRCPNSASVRSENLVTPCVGLPKAASRSNSFAKVARRAASSTADQKVLLKRCLNETHSESRVARARHEATTSSIGRPRVKEEKRTATPAPPMGCGSAKGRVHVENSSQSVWLTRARAARARARTQTGPTYQQVTTRGGHYMYRLRSRARSHPHTLLASAAGGGYGAMTISILIHPHTSTWGGRQVE